MNVLDQQIQDNYGSICDSKEACKNDLKQSYIQPGHPIAFSGIFNIYQYYKPLLSIADIESVLSEIENYTLHREFHNLQRNPSYSHFKRYQFQCDLVDVRSLAPYNNNVNYLFTCIDTFTRYAFVRLLRSKHGPVVLEAFKSILEEAVEPPQMLVLDRGTEFYNVHFQDFCRDNKVFLYSPDTSIHGAYIERFNRTLQSIIYKYMTENETNRYIEYTDEQGRSYPLMPRFVSTYNNRRHRMIGTTPYNAENNPNIHLAIRTRLSRYYETIKEKKPKFIVGDLVRIIKLKGKFDRGYNERAAREIFKIHEVRTNLKKPLYVLSNFRGDEIIKGRFYQHELTKVGGDVYRIEKILKKRKIRGKNQILVKWKGFDESYNSWVDESQITKRFQR